MGITFIRLDDVEENRNKLHHGASEDEDMEDRMHVAMLLADAVKNRADRVGNATEQEPEEPGEGDRFNGGFCGKQDAPAHSNVAAHGEFGVFFEVDRGKDGRQCRASPNDAENDPSPSGGNGTDRGKEDGSVRSRDQEVNGAVIQHLKYLFGKSRMQSVIDAGCCVKQDQGCAVDGTADHTPHVSVQSGKQDA